MKPDELPFAIFAFFVLAALCLWIAFLLGSVDQETSFKNNACYSFCGSKARTVIFENGKNPTCWCKDGSSGIYQSKKERTLFEPAREAGAPAKQTLGLQPELCPPASPRFTLEPQIFIAE
jgi:hypothetical protein